MGLKLIVAAYLALVAVLCAAGIFVVSVHGMQELRLTSLDNAYFIAPKH
jgi:hypothetical protein